MSICMCARTRLTHSEPSNSEYGESELLSIYGGKPLIDIIWVEEYPIYKENDWFMVRCRRPAP